MLKSEKGWENTENSYDSKGFVCVEVMSWATLGGGTEQDLQARIPQQEFRAMLVQR